MKINNYLLIGVIIAVVIIIFLTILNSNNQQESVTCNTPYIKMGTSCCLDQDSNDICDGDGQNIQQVKEETEEEVPVENEEQKLCSKYMDCLEKAILQKDIQYCDYILEVEEDREDLKWGCYEELAVETKDDSYCDKIAWNYYDDFRGENKQDYCHSRTAPCVEDYTLCNQIESDDLADDCYRQTAMATNDARACSNIKSEEWKNWCYNHVGDCINDYNICEQAGSYHDTCIIEIVREKRETDISVCNRIEEDKWKSACNSEIEMQDFLDPNDEQYEELCDILPEMCCLSGLTC